MGMHVSAYLAYGVHFTDEEVESLPWFDPESEDGSLEEKFEEWLAKVSGLVDPSAHITDRVGEWKKWHENPENASAMSEYWRKKRELLKQCPITPVFWSSFDEEPEPLIIAVNSSVTTGNWEKPMEPTMSIEDADIEAAKSFCAKHSIPFDQPTWLLAARAIN